jgi:hypothetical protein
MLIEGLSGPNVNKKPRLDPSAAIARDHFLPPGSQFFITDDVSINQANRVFLPPHPDPLPHWGNGDRERLSAVLPLPPAGGESRVRGGNVILFMKPCTKESGKDFFGHRRKPLRLPRRMEDVVHLAGQFYGFERLLKERHR